MCGYMGAGSGGAHNYIQGEFMNCKSVCPFLLLLLIASPAALRAQPASVAAPQASAERGAYGAMSISSSKNSVAGYSVLLTPAAGYDFNSHLGMEAGLPYYALASTEVVTITTQGGRSMTQSNDASNLLGDLYLRFALTGAPIKSLLYQGTVTGRAPTGDAASGVSTGRATWNWNNRFEVDAFRIAPYVEAGIGNTEADSNRYLRSYTTLGYVAPFAAGMNIDLGRHLGFDASTYYDLPFGDQKLYSRVSRTDASLPITSGRLASYMQGGPALTEDHGFNGALTYTPTPRFALSVYYNRSISDALDEAMATLSFHIGHIDGQSRGRD